MKKGLLVASLMLLRLVAFCQNTIGLPQILNYTNTDYRAGTQTWDAEQDKWGRMYFANNEGLITFDGNYWKVYPQPNKTILRSIGIDTSLNRVYAGGQDELGYFEPGSNGVLQYTSLKQLIPRPKNQFTDVWDIEFLNGSVFFRTPDRIFEYKNETILVYPAISEWSFLKNVGGKLFAQDREKGIFQFINNGWQPICQPAAVPNFEITGIISLSSDSLLISSLTNGFYTFSRGLLSKKITVADAALKEKHIYTIEKINNTEFVAGTVSDGCFILNNEGDIIQQISRNEGLQNNNVLSLFLDKNQNLWAGLNNGISFIAYSAAIKYIKPSKNNEVAGYSSCVYNNQLYIASSDGAYAATLFNSDKDISFSKGAFSLITGSSGQAWHLSEVNKQLLMGHHNGSYTIQNRQAIPLFTGIGNWLYVPVSSVFPSSLVVAGTYAGLSLIEFNNITYKNSYNLKGINESLRFLATDNSGVFWASHPYRGIYKLTIDTAGKSFSAKLYTEKDGLPSSLRNHVFRIANRVVVATEKGVYELDANKGWFTPSAFLLTVFGTTSLQYLNEDAAGNIWFCSGKKIGVAQQVSTPEKYRIIYFPELTGKILSGFENVYPFSDENIFIASDNGIIHLNYKKYLQRNVGISVLLTQVKALGKTDSLIFGGYFAKTQSNQYRQKQLLEFAKSFNSFHFEFSAPAFGEQKNIEYSYQLDGYDNTWSAWVTKPEKDYTNLPNGTYTFKVKARDNFGNECEPVSYQFVVKPAWYKTVWAYAFYVVLVVALVFLVNRYQKTKLLKQQLQFEEEQKRLKYIHQLEVEKNEKEIIKLQNEKLANEVIYKNRELADVSMHLVERSDALLKVKDELQRLYKKTGENHDIKKSIQLLNDVEKNNSSWEQFASHFDEVNNDFLKKLKLKYPALTSTDLKMCTYLHLKLSSKEIAQLMNITVRGVEISRYRLRKKLSIPQEKTLFDFLQEAGNTEK
jgi:membrane protein implicated in regulation of membrane protease activity